EAVRRAAPAVAVHRVVVSRSCIDWQRPPRLTIEEAGTADRRTIESDFVNDHALARDPVVKLSRSGQTCHSRLDRDVAGGYSRAGKSGQADLDHLDGRPEWKRIGLQRHQGGRRRHGDFVHSWYPAQIVLVGSYVAVTGLGAVHRGRGARVGGM